MSINEFFILDSLNSFLLMSLASIFVVVVVVFFFTSLGIIAIYFRHKPSQVVAAVVKRFQKFDIV